MRATPHFVRFRTRTDHDRPSWNASRSDQRSPRRPGADHHLSDIETAVPARGESQDVRVDPTAQWRAQAWHARNMPPG